MNLEDQRSNCPGYLDEHGIWNNGFECPSLPNQRRVCCGSTLQRYCCLLEHSNPSVEPSTDTTSSLLNNINLTWLTLPMRLTCLVILLLLFLLILFLCYRHHQRKNTSFEPKPVTTKETLLIDHFPFSPPHHQFFFTETNHPIKETLTTSTSSSSARLPSDMYFNDWKEFFHPIEQSINVYPTISSHSYDMKNYYSQDDVIV